MYSSIAYHMINCHHNNGRKKLKKHHGSHNCFSEKLVEVFRGSFVESLHRGAIVVCKKDGTLLKKIGYSAMPTFLRSTAKPLQVLPLIMSGAADAFGFTSRELACCSGSLNGEFFQTEVLFSILKKIKLDFKYLKCGIHRPSHIPTMKKLKKKKESFTEIHNNCAGKHVAMLAMCVYQGYNLENYTEIEHPVQSFILKEISEMCDYPKEQIGISIDGCGVPVYRVPLFNLAVAYSRLAAPEDSNFSEKKIKAIKRLVNACVSYPEMIAGTDRVCTDIMKMFPGFIFAKTGAEGTYALALLKEKLGIAIQVEDGNMRVIPSIIIEILRQLNCGIDGQLEEYLHKKNNFVRNNHCGQKVSYMKPVFELE